jgi:hypothetical protein
LQKSQHHAAPAWISEPAGAAYIGAMPDRQPTRTPTMNASATPYDRYEIDLLRAHAYRQIAPLRQQALEENTAWLAGALATGLERIARGLRIAAGQTFSTPTPHAIAASRSASS